MSGASQPPGWYPAEGDPAGTVRWWDGNSWVGGPQEQGAQQQAGYVAPGGNTLPTGQELADPWLRIGADIIDGVLVFIVTTVLLIVFVGTAAVTDAFGNGGLLNNGIGVGVALLLSVIGSAYYWAMNSFVGGTLGKMLLGIRISDTSGNVPIGPAVGFVRSLSSIVPIIGIIPFIGLLLLFARFIVALVSLVFMFTDPQRRTVMDRLASTYVVKA